MHFSLDMYVQHVYTMGVHCERHGGGTRDRRDDMHTSTATATKRDAVTYSDYVHTIRETGMYTLTIFALGYVIGVYRAQVAVVVTTAVNMIVAAVLKQTVTR